MCDPALVLSRRPKRNVFRAIVRAAALSLVAIGAGCGSDDGGTDDPGFLSTGRITLEDQGWVCGGKVDLDHLEVTVRNANIDAVQFGPGCTGRIGELVVVQYRQDGVKVAEGAHDVVVERGTIECRGRKAGAHQDGVQALGGDRITFHDLRVDCPTATNSAFFVRQGGMSQRVPTDVVCDGCFFRGGGYAVRINESLRSGIRNSTVCTGKFGALRILDGASRPVDEGNRIVSCD
jgi:hypothetical protein